MKRIIVLGITLVLILICLGGCGSKTIDKPADTNLEFWITEDVTAFDFSGYYSVPGWFGASEYYALTMSLRDLMKIIFLLNPSIV